jgi:hypothetical protein
MKTTKGALRNMTSGRLHTDIGQVYQFIEEYTGEKGIMTHHIPSACRALLPILKTKLGPEWFTDEWIKEGLSESVEVSDLTVEERKLFWDSFNGYAAELLDSIKDKTIIVKV